MIRYERFLHRLLPQAPGCSDPTAVDALRQAAIEFCATSMWVTYETDPVTVLAGEPVYEIDVPEGQVVETVQAVYVEGVKLSPISLEELDRQHTNWRANSGTPTRFFQHVPGEIVLYPSPDVRSTNALVLSITTRPSQDSDGVEDSVYEWWFDTIVVGALAKLLALPGQQFSNPAAATANAISFRSGVGVARARRMQSLTRRPLRAQYPRFA